MFKFTSLLNLKLIFPYRLLDNIFQAMVLMVGLDDLVTQRNLERTKRDIRSSFALIDRFLETVAPTENLSTFGDLLGATDCVIFPEAANVHNHLENFVESVDSTYGCVLLRGHVVTATKNWWGLHPDEIVLLTNYLLSEVPAVMKDTPVFLPVKSPTVPFRLVTCELVEGVTLCALCGPNPSLMELQPVLHKHWKNTLALMTSLTSIMPRKFPPLQIDKTIQGFVLVNLEKRKIFSSMFPHGEEGDSKQMTTAKKIEVLRYFIRNTVGPIFPDIFVPNPYSVDSHSGENMAYRVPHTQLTHPVSETYSNFDYYKCYALQHLQYQFFGIFVAAVPNFSLRNIAHRTLQFLLKDKTFSVVTK